MLSMKMELLNGKEPSDEYLESVFKGNNFITSNKLKIFPVQLTSALLQEKVKPFFLLN